MDLILKNLMEPLVSEKLERTLAEIDCCKCRKCQLDMMSYALNQLPPKYYATHVGSLYSRVEQLSQQHGADVLSAIIRAIKIVSEHPHHEDEHKID